MVNKNINISQAEKINQEAIIFDGHCDTVLDIFNKKRSLGEKSDYSHLDIPRMKKGGVNVQFFAAFIEEIYKPNASLKRTLQLIDCIYQQIEKNKEAFDSYLESKKSDC